MSDVVTMVVWMCCAAIGAFGLTTAYPAPTVRSPNVPPVQAEILQVQLAPRDHDLPAPQPLPASPPTLTPPTLQPIALPPQTSLATVAEPTPLVAFPLPLERPVRLAEPDQATLATLETTPGANPAPGPPVQTLAYGHGEGRQPAPEYPRQAMREGQEGVVTLRFSVGESGRVLAAETVSATPWPLLNNAALRAVRERWRFRPGPPRLYEVAIRFELHRRETESQRSAL
jgi:protein TonB